MGIEFEDVAVEGLHGVEDADAVLEACIHEWDGGVVDVFELAVEVCFHVWGVPCWCVGLSVVQVDDGFGELSLYFVESVAEAVAGECGEVELSVATLVEAGVDFGFGDGGIGVELHAVGFDAHDGLSVGGESDVGDDGEHGVGEVLDHEWHAVGFCPAE